MRAHLRVWARGTDALARATQVPAASGHQCAQRGEGAVTVPRDAEPPPPSHSPTPAFNKLFPVVLGVFCPCVFFGLFERLCACFGKSRFRVTEEGFTDETTAKGRAIVEREKESVRNGGRPGELHTAFTLRRDPKPKKRGHELNRVLFGGGRAAPKPGDDAREQQGLLADEAHPPAPGGGGGGALSRAEELKARLAARVEAARTRNAAPPTSSWSLSGPAVPAPPAATTAAAAPPSVFSGWSSRPAPAATLVPIASAAPAAGGAAPRSRLDDLFA